MSNPGRTERLPIFPLGTVLTPGMPLSLHIFEPRYRQLVADLLDADDPRAPEFGVVALRAGWEVGEVGDLHPVGTTARVTDVLPLPDGRCNLSATGERRFRIEQLHPDDRPYLMATVSWVPETSTAASPAAVAATRRAVVQHQSVLGELGIEVEALAGFGADTDPEQLSYLAARLATIPLTDRQAVLAGASMAERMATTRAVLRRETELIRVLHAIPVGAEAFRSGPGGS